MTWSQTRQKMYESFFLPVNETADLRSNSSRQAVRTGVLPPFTKTQSSMNHVAPTTSFSCHTLPESYSKVNLNFRHKHTDFTALSQDAVQTCWGTLFNKWKVKQTIEGFKFNSSFSQPQNASKSSAAVQGKVFLLKNRNFPEKQEAANLLASLKTLFWVAEHFLWYCVLWPHTSLLELRAICFKISIIYSEWQKKSKLTGNYRWTTVFSLRLK